MTILDFQGVPIGTLPTLANSGLSFIFPGGSNSIVAVSDGSSPVGDRHLRFTCGSTANPCVVEWTLNPDVEQIQRFAMRLPSGGFAASPGPTSIFKIQAGTPTVFRVLVANTGAVTCQGRVGASATVNDLSPYWNQWISMQLWTDGGTTTGNGDAELRFYTTPAAPANGAGGTYIGSVYLAPGTWDLGAGTNQTTARFGFDTAQAALTVGTTKVMDLAYVQHEASSDTPTFLAGVPAAAAPVADIQLVGGGRTARVEVGATVNLTSAGSTGTITGRTYTGTHNHGSTAAPAFQNPTSATPSFVATTVGTYTIHAAVNGPGGSDDTTAGSGTNLPVVVRVRPPMGGRITVASGVLGTWSLINSATGVADAMNDASPTGVASTDNPDDTQALLLVLDPVMDGSFRLSPELSESGTGTLDHARVQVFKNDGSTLIDEWEETDITGTPVVFPHTVANVATLIPDVAGGDRDALVVKVFGSVSP